MKSTYTNRIAVFSIAALLVTPMPIAGGIPIMIGISAILLACISVSFSALSVNSKAGLLLALGVALLLWEVVGLIYHQGYADINYVLSRGLWLVLGFSYMVLLFTGGENLIRKRLEAIFLIALSALIFLMVLEAMFYPKHELGRQLGTINLPFPRATGVPQSDGKIGAFCSIAFAYFLMMSFMVKRAIYPCGALLSLLPICFTQSRSSILAVAVVLVFIAAFRLIIKYNALTAVVLILGMCIAVPLVISGFEGVYFALKGEGLYANNVDARFHGIEYAKDMIGRYPWLGAGGDSLIMDGGAGDGVGVHNTFAAMLIKNGIVGLVLYSSFYIGCGVFAIRMARVSYIQATMVVLAITSGPVVEHMLYPGLFDEHLWLIPVAVHVVSQTYAESFRSWSANG